MGDYTAKFIPTVYPRGYGNKVEEEDIRFLMTDQRIHLFDTRMSPATGFVAYQKASLGLTYQDRYHPCGKFLGNERYNDGPPHKIVNMKDGLVGLFGYLCGSEENTISIVLMCGCSTIHEGQEVALCECPTNKPCERCIPYRGKQGCHVNTIIQALHKLRPGIPIEYAYHDDSEKPAKKSKKKKTDVEYAIPLF